MKHIQWMMMAAVLFSSGAAFGKIFPDNNFNFLDDPQRIFNIDQSEFTQAIDDVINAWKTYAQMHGATLQGVKKWSSSTVNAQATREGDKWLVTIFGGLARQKDMTKDGLTVVVCHELGHHFAGYAFYDDMEDWAASEGEADYFATHVCTRHLWENQVKENARFRATANATVREKCDKIWSDTNEQNLCYRSAEASLSIAKVLASLTQLPVPQFDTPDSSEVSETFTDHPKAQCRLDTYFNGGLCPVQFDLTLIPGLAHPAGQNSVDAEQIAFQHSCATAAGFSTGFRPRCWFKPHQ